MVLNSVQEPSLLHPIQVADQLGVALKTLENWRAEGRGPGFIKLGSNGLVRYEQVELDRWKAANREVRS